MAYLSVLGSRVRPFGVTKRHRS